MITLKANSIYSLWIIKLICPYCRHEDIRVVDSRDSGDEIRRRRECSVCLRRFTTYERVQTRIFQVVKKDQRREGLNKEKLLDSLFNACAKRPCDSIVWFKFDDLVIMLLINTPAV